MKLFEAEVDGGPALRGQRWARLAFILLVWVLVGLFFSSQVYFYSYGTTWQTSFPRALAWQMSAVIINALFTPFVLWLARRYRVERQTWLRTLPLHLLACAAVAAVCTTYHLALDFAVMGKFGEFTLGRLPRLVFANIDKNLLIYAIIVVISHAADYYQRYREGELRASQAQLQALKMQLHPHFLFNALHSISALVHTDPDAADKMIARLGDFLRLTLESSAAQVVPLRQEIEFLNCYLEIERIRFRDRLTTRIEVDPQVLDCGVPNLILQPIVENAIRHGVSQRTGPGHVEVTAGRAGTSLRLEVRDNGRGLPERPAASAAKGGGVGLANTRARLQRLYGAAYRFELANAPAGGAVVTLEIPLQGSPAESPARPDEDSAALGSHAPGAKPRAADPRAVSSRA